MRHSKLIISTAAAISAIVGIGSASAADLPARTYTKAPVVVDPGYNWSGFYVGINGGGAWASRSGTVDFTSDGFDPGPAFPKSRGSGGVAGVHAGYNWQVAPTWVLGLEGDWDWASVKHNRAAPLLAGGVPFFIANTQENDNLQWLASIRGRLGYTIGSVMLYGTGGVAWSQTNFNGYGQNNSPSQAIFSVNKTTTGWVAGAGAEWMVASNWILRAEYLYYGFSNGITAVAVSNNIPNGIGGAPAVFTYGSSDVQSARVGVSYKFGAR